MRKILITGANGFLGQHLSLFLHTVGYAVIATGRGPSRLPFLPGITYEAVDLSDTVAVRNMVATHQPDVIIHNAAMSKPDECNNNRQECLQVNVGSTMTLVNCPCDHFIYLSTDFIFGEGGPHSEDDTPAPLNFYGESKLAAENLIKASGHKHAIVRPVFIYGKVWEGLRPSFLHWVKNSLEQNKPIKVVSDQQRTPTSVEDICKGIEKIISLGATGDYHLAGKDILSPYDMALKTAEVLNLDASLIERVTADTFPEPVRRAKRSGLKIDKAISDLNYDPVSFEEGVRRTFTS